MATQQRSRATLLLLLRAFATTALGELVDVDVRLLPGAELRRFTIEVRSDWSPLGASRFLELVEADYYDDCAFFRTIKGFMAQFGISGNATKQRLWRRRPIRDEAEARSSNERGTVTFAHAGKHTRSTQLFINFRDNKFLDRQGFPPIGRVVSGMDVVDSLTITGEGAPQGPGPSQQAIQTQGDAYLRDKFPDLSRIVSTKLRSSTATTTTEATRRREQEVVVAEKKPRASSSAKAATSDKVPPPKAGAPYSSSSSSSGAPGATTTTTATLVKERPLAVAAGVVAPLAALFCRFLLKKRRNFTKLPQASLSDFEVSLTHVAVDKEH